MCHVFFFFSSRRRHTRCSRDWSSDVCSSDLVAAAELPALGFEGTPAATLRAQLQEALGAARRVLPQDSAAHSALSEQLRRLEGGARGAGWLGRDRAAGPAPPGGPLPGHSPWGPTTGAPPA